MNKDLSNRGLLVYLKDLLRKAVYEENLQNQGIINISDMLKLIKATEFLSYRFPQLKKANFDNPGDVVAFPEDDDLSDTEILHEQLIDDSDLLPIHFLEQGLNVQRAVARIVLAKSFIDHNGRHFYPGTGIATGFMVSSSLLLTNYHVVENFEDVDRQLQFEFNYQVNDRGNSQTKEIFFADSRQFFYQNPQLDYALIRIKPNISPLGAERRLAGEVWGEIPLPRSQIFLQEGKPVNIIQHPQGRYKEIALQNNRIVTLTENVVRYQSDTEAGSSGSPVLNNRWQLVALHQGSPVTPKDYNQGIRIDRIVEDMRKAFNQDSSRTILNELNL
jgi:endonuclease G